MRYCARPALSLSRLRRTADGRYAYELKYPSAGRTHLVLTPLGLLSRLALLVAPPRYPLVRYTGVFAPGHALRAAVVARAPGPNALAGAGGCSSASAIASRRRAETPDVKRVGSRAAAVAAVAASPLAVVGGGDPAEGAEHATSLRGAVAAATSRDKRIDWATLLRRTYHLDALACP